jgi:N-acetylglucosaminyl-diphospho-decaprenol L-rhamnosyltransferase
MVSIVIVNWNSDGLLESCVRSLLDNATGCQIVIVDNASTDASLDFNMDAENISIIRNDNNIGFAAACNLGWNASAGAHVLFLNPDTEAYPDSIRSLEHVLIMDSSVWAVGGRLISPSGESAAYLRPFPTIGRVAREMLLIDEILPIDKRRSNKFNNSAVPMEIDQPAAACLMVSREALVKIGGFDETFSPAWFEDVDLCRRIWNRGGRILYHPAACFLHHGGYTLKRLTNQTFLEIFHSNQIRYFQKHHGKRAASLAKTLIFCGLLLRSAASLAHPLAPDASRLTSAKTFWNVAMRLLHSPGVHA